MQKNLISLSIAVLLFNVVATSQTLTCGTSSVTFTYAGTSVTYGTVTNPATGRCWLDRNLGASQVATSSTDALAYGDLFQWGRGDDGHQMRASTTTTTTSSTSVPGHGEFISGSSDWLTTPNPNLWQGVSGINNSCPSGWRVPTRAEWEAELASWTAQNSAGAFLSPLKLTLAGRRNPTTGNLESVGMYARYWSSTVAGTSTSTSSYRLDFSSTDANVGTGSKSTASSVRCIYDCPTGAGNLSGNQTICIGTTSSFSSTVSGGTWSSANTAIATVDGSSGLVSGVSGGTTIITYTIAGTGSCTSVTSTRAITVTAAPVFSPSGPFLMCVDATYLVSLSTPNSFNGWSSSNSSIFSVTGSGYITASQAGTATITYTDACGQSVSQTVVVQSSAPSIPLTDNSIAYKFNGSPQGPLSGGATINYVGYDGYSYLSQMRPSSVGFYRANIQSANQAGCPDRFYIFTCTTCDPFR